MNSWTFAFVTDIHVGSPHSYRFQPAWRENWYTAREQLLAAQPEFLLVGGDMTRDGDLHRDELLTMKDDFDRLPFPVHVIPGNHEVGNKFRPGWEFSIGREALDLYRSVFGPSEWDVVHGNVRVCGMNALLFGSGLPDEDALWTWLEARQPDPGIDHQVWLMHPALFIDRPDEADWDEELNHTDWYFGVDAEHRARVYEVLRRTRTRSVLTGHIHCRRQAKVDGITFEFGPSTAFPQWGDRWPDGDDTLGFMLFHVNGDNLESEFVPLRTVSALPGYGPGGHVTASERDYSLATKGPAWDPAEQARPGSP